VARAHRPEAHRLPDDGATSDPELIRAVQEGSAAALETLYRRYLPSIWRYVCARLGGDGPAAEDVVSETFLAAIRAVGEIDPHRGPLCAWLTGIARHKLGDHWRRARRRPRQLASPVAERSGAPDPPAPDGAAEAAESRAIVVRAMAALRDDERMALEWKYLDALAVRQIADRLGRSEKAAEALLYRARKSFRAVFEGFGASAD